MQLSSSSMAKFWLENRTLQFQISVEVPVS